MAEFDNPTRWDLSDLSEASLTFSNDQADINCTHAEVAPFDISVCYSTIFTAYERGFLNFTKPIWKGPMVGEGDDA